MLVAIKVGNLRFVARLEDQAAPKTCHAFHNTGQPTCEPQERSITVRSWANDAPPKCSPHPRRYATAAK